MHASQAVITVNELGPAKLIDRLANHWAHKFEVERGEGRAVIPFPTATCVLQAQGDELLARLESDDAGAVEKLEGVVADHLQRMARGEALSIEWTRVG